MSSMLPCSSLPRDPVASDLDDVPTPVTALIAALSQTGEMLTTPLPRAPPADAIEVRSDLSATPPVLPVW